MGTARTITWRTIKSKMGVLLSKFQGSQAPSEVFVDFAAAEPQTDAERAVFDQVQEVINQADEILQSLLTYEGCGELIREAIVSPSDESTSAAWEAVIPKVHLLRDFYEFSVTLTGVIPSLLQALCEPGNAEETLVSMQSLTRQMADIMNFVLRFDDSKMTNPAIQNDFSFYRRTLNKMKMTDPNVTVPIKDDLANKMSLFYAYPTPMMKCLSETTVSFVGTASIPRESVTDVFACMANACYSMVHLKKFDDPANPENQDKLNMFCLRALTASIITFDHTDPVGAFHKKSPIHAKNAITTLKNFTPMQPGDHAETESLINALRFTTVHLNDEGVPSSVQALLE